MKLAQARLVTGDVPALARFCQDIRRIAPIGSEDYPCVVCELRGL